MARKKKTNAVPFACGPGTVAVALPGPPVELWWTSWDHGADCFLPWRILPLPTLFGEVGFLAAAFVANYEHGLYQPYLVVQRGFSVLVALLDFENEQLNVLADISLHGGFPSKKKKISSHPEEIVEDCWLVDGPTVIASCHGRILVASPQCVTKVPAWRAHVVMPQHTDIWKRVKLVYCGTVGVEAIFVSVPRARKDHLSERPGDGISFSVLLDSPSDSAIYPILLTDTTPLSARTPGVANPLVKDFSLIRLAGLKPSSITCLATVPSPGAHSCGRVGDDMVDIVFVTVDKKLIRCRDGKVLTSMQLEEVPSMVPNHYRYFAVVGDGQGILLVVSKGEAPDVVAVCAETYQKLKSWTGVSGVLLSDICMLGHDQIILFPKSQYWNSGLHGEGQGNIVISDLIMSLDLGSGVLLSQSEVRNAQDLPTFMTDSILISLNSRVQAGILEFNDAVVERSKKMELIRSSCYLVQDMESRSTQPYCSNVERSDNVALQFVRAITTMQKVYDRTWFLMVDIEGHVPKGTNLHDLSLVLTTQHGHIVGESSVLGSLSQAGAGQLIAIAPLMEFSGLSSLIINVLLTAIVSTGGIQAVACNNDPPEKKFMSSGHSFSMPLHVPKMTMQEAGSKSSQNMCCKTYTQWLCKVEAVVDSLNQCFDSRWSIGFREVATQQELVISSTGEEHLSLLPAIIKSSLSMVDNRYTAHDSRVLEFAMPPGLPRAEITASLFSTIAVLSLRSSDFRHIVLMERCLKRSLKHRFKLLPRACAPDMSLHATQFASEFLRELTHSVDGQHVKIGSKRKQGSTDKLSTLSSMQILTDRVCSHFLQFISPSTQLEL